MAISYRRDSTVISPRDNATRIEILGKVKNGEIDVHKLDRHLLSYILDVYNLSHEGNNYDKAVRIIDFLEL